MHDRRRAGGHPEWRASHALVLVARGARTATGISAAASDGWRSATTTRSLEARTSAQEPPRQPTPAGSSTMAWPAGPVATRGAGVAEPLAGGRAERPGLASPRSGGTSDGAAEPGARQTRAVGVHDRRRRSGRLSSSSTVIRTARALDPSEGPTTPRRSSRSISRPARAKPTRSFRCSIEVDPSWDRTTSSMAGRGARRRRPRRRRHHCRHPHPFDAHHRLGGAALATPVGDHLADLSSETQGPWSRRGMFEEAVRSSMSPLPISRSAPAGRG